MTDEQKQSIKRSRENLKMAQRSNTRCGVDIIAVVATELINLREQLYNMDNMVYSAGVDVEEAIRNNCT